MSAGFDRNTAAFDLAVIGAGPAGAAAALTAARLGLTVALFEPARALDKPCGEGILPSGVRALRELGLDELLQRGRALERIGYVLASGRELEIAFRTPGCALDRPTLARALGDAMDAESRITRFARHAESEREADGFRIASGDERWSAATLIAADGLNGGAAEWLRRPRGGAGRFGLRARAEAGGELGRVEVHLGRETEVYLTPLPGQRVNVAVLCSQHPGERSSAACLAAALAEHPRATRTLGAWITAPEARTLVRERPRALAGHGAFLAGDAAGGVDPVLGCGVAIALTTGIAAARAAARVLAQGSGAPERDYARLVAHETRTRRAVAQGLTLLAAHPRLQELARSVFTSWPSGAERLAQRIAGA